jgi:YcxB-like protein
MTAEASSFDLMPTITLTYTSKRSEVWHWYWRSWRKKLWIYHAYCLVMLPVLAVLFLDRHWPPHDYKNVLYGLSAAVAIVGFFIAFPQIVFKPQVRKLTVNEDGIATTIGKKSGTFKWQSIAAIEDTPELIMIRRTNGNALLVPRRAFNSEQEKSDFLAALNTFRL